MFACRWSPVIAAINPEPTGQQPRASSHPLRLCRQSHCVNVVTDRPEWANGVLMRAVALPAEPERVAAGPGLLARRFGIDRSDDRRPATGEHGVWLAPRPASIVSPDLVTTTRIGISEGNELLLRWYLRASRSVSRRAKGDRQPVPDQSWAPKEEDGW